MNLRSLLSGDPCPFLGVLNDPVELGFLGLALLPRQSQSGVNRVGDLPPLQPRRSGLAQYRSDRGQEPQLAGVTNRCSPLFPVGPNDFIGRGSVRLIEVARLGSEAVDYGSHVRTEYRPSDHQNAWLDRRGGPRLRPRCQS